MSELQGTDGKQTLHSLKSRQVMFALILCMSNLPHQKIPRRRMARGVAGAETIKGELGVSGQSGADTLSAPIKPRIDRP